MSKIKVMTIFGTRPEAIKMAPVIKEMDKEKNIKSVVTVTAQHRSMLDQVLELFKISPDHDLDIMEKKQSLFLITTKVLQGLEKIYKSEKPDLILVQGDTSTTFVASLAAYYQKIRIGHLEAGLRTYNKYSPFPEEINRHLTDVLADLYFAPTEDNRRALEKENISPEKIMVTGNTVIDALHSVVTDQFKFKNSILQKLNFREKKIILLTAHRRENIGQPLINICKAAREIVKKYTDVEIVFPVHLNPEVKKIVYDILDGNKKIHLIKPLQYQTFANLMAKSYLVLTDSGGLQEEAPSLGRPVLVLRNSTERREAVISGTVKIAGTDKNNIIKETGKLLNNKKQYEKMSGSANPYGDGKASQRIVNRILSEFADIFK